MVWIVSEGRHGRMVGDGEPHGRSLVRVRGRRTVCHMKNSDRSRARASMLLTMLASLLAGSTALAVEQPPIAIERQLSCQRSRQQQADHADMSTRKAKDLR